jgi:hypothetical protein
MSEDKSGYIRRSFSCGYPLYPEQQATPKLWYRFTRLHRVTSQNTVILKNRIIMSYLEVAVWVTARLTVSWDNWTLLPMFCCFFRPPSYRKGEQRLRIVRSAEGGTDVLSGRRIVKNLIRTATIFEVELISSSSLR